jgi:hypothetical protein
VKLVFDRLVGRLGAIGWPAELVIRAATPSVMTAGENATLHLELDGAIADPR